MMFPPGPTGYLDIEAVSGICGSISIACWVVVFSPQIIENFRRRSADGLSLLFLFIWLVGDVFNILGAVLQGVLPTMIILAVYYTLADIVLVIQCLYYHGFLGNCLGEKQGREQQENGEYGEEHYDEQGEGEEQGPSSTQSRRSTTDVVPEPSEQTSLLYSEQQRRNGRPQYDGQGQHHHFPRDRRRRRSSLASFSSLREHFSLVDSTHLSPATPFILEPPKPTTTAERREQRQRQRSTPASTLQIVAFNSFAVALVCAAGVLGWYFGIRYRRRGEHGHRHRHNREHPSSPAALEFDIAGQIFGYLCAALYLGSRIPQLLLNWRRRSTEGVSLLFFLFACIGNLTYVLSILAYSPVCEGYTRRGGREGGKEEEPCRPGETERIYGRYILVNLSWLLGSLGTLFLDLSIFAQFIMYRQKDFDDSDEDDGDDGAVVERG